MTVEEVIDALDAYLHVNWTSTDIHEENYEFDTDISTAFIEPIFLSGEVFEGELAGPDGDGISVRIGVYMINIYTPLNEGYKTAYGYAAELEDLFYYKIIKCVKTERPRTDRLGPDGKHFRLAVVVPIWSWTG